jgi:PTS system nitrogen regulatory IIA component
MTPLLHPFPMYDVLLDVDLPDTQSLFDAVARLWAGQEGAVASEIVSGLSAREALGSTGIGQGVAIPHARCRGLRQPLATLARAKTPIEFDAPDDRPVDCCVVLLIPEDAIDPHLQLLAQVARVLSSASARAAFRAATTADEVARVFRAPQQQLYDARRPAETPVAHREAAAAVHREAVPAAQRAPAAAA